MEALDADHQRVIEEQNWAALQLEAEGGVRTIEEIELVFAYWFGHRHDALPEAS